MPRADDVRFMSLALSLGRRGLGRVWPWPSVGCVIVRDGRIVGRGCTDRSSMQHAERVALAQAGDRARGATAYVSLEPCSHHGTTPPCTDALIAAGIARVVAAIADPNPQVSCLAPLQAAGITVQIGLCEDAARHDHAGFFKVQSRGRPMVALKLAGSFDGRIATATGESQWITGPKARRVVHAMRARHDAVLVGAGTVRADDPTLTVRGLGPVSQPVRVVASCRLDIPMGRLAETLDQAPLWLCHGQDAPAKAIAAWQEAGAQTIECHAKNRQIDPADMMSKLAGAGLTRIYCEGGGALAASLLAADAVDEVIGFTAGLMLGAEGMPSVGAMGVAKLDEAPRFDLIESRPVGPDLMHRWHRRDA